MVRKTSWARPRMTTRSTLNGTIPSNTARAVQPITNESAPGEFVTVIGTTTILGFRVNKQVTSFWCLQRPVASIRRPICRFQSSTTMFTRTSFSLLTSTTLSNLFVARANWNNVLYACLWKHSGHNNLFFKYAGGHYVTECMCIDGLNLRRMGLALDLLDGRRGRVLHARRLLGKPGAPQVRLNYPLPVYYSCQLMSTWGCY